MPSKPVSEAQRRTRVENLRPFAKGVSGNPSGRPRGLLALVRAATDDGAKIVDVLAGIMSDAEAKPSDRIAAAKELADRLWGRAPQVTELTGKDGGPLEVQQSGRYDFGRLRPDQALAIREALLAAKVDDEPAA